MHHSSKCLATQWEPGRALRQHNLLVKHSCAWGWGSGACKQPEPGNSGAPEGPGGHFARQRARGKNALGGTWTLTGVRRGVTQGWVAATGLVRRAVYLSEEGGLPNGTQPECGPAEGLRPDSPSSARRGSLCGSTHPPEAVAAPACPPSPCPLLPPLPWALVWDQHFSSLVRNVVFPFKIKYFIEKCLFA